MDILELVSSALSNLNIPVIYGWYDESLNKTHVTFLEFDNQDDEYLDDEASENNHHIQVDIWTKDLIESQTLKKKVKELLKEKGLSYQDGQDQFEKDTKLWHIAQRYLIVENLK